MRLTEWRYAEDAPSDVSTDRELIAQWAEKHGWNIDRAVTGRAGDKTVLTWRHGDYHVTITLTGDVVTHAEKGTAVSGYTATGSTVTGPELLDIVGLMLEDTE